MRSGGNFLSSVFGKDQMDELDYQNLPLTPAARENFKRLEAGRHLDFRKYIANSPDVDVGLRNLTEGRLRDYLACLLQSGTAPGQIGPLVKQWAQMVANDGERVLKDAVDRAHLLDAHLDYIFIDFDGICQQVCISGNCPPERHRKRMTPDPGNLPAWGTIPKNVAAKALGVTVRTIERMLKDGRLTRAGKPNLPRVKTEEIRGLIASRGLRQRRQKKSD